MKEILDNVFSTIWKFFASGRGFGIALGLLVLIVFISYIAQYAQFNCAVKEFISGTYNAKTFRVLEKFKRRSIFPQSAELHDQCCCMLSAMYLEKGNVASYFDNINAVRNVTDKFSWRVYLLLASYLTGENYHDVAAIHRSRDENQSTAETIVQFLQAHDRNTIYDKTMSAKENITQQQFLEVLYNLGDSPK